MRLAQRPTPLEPFPPLPLAPGVQLWIKRDDLTGSTLTGNKVRKLEFLLEEAIEQGARAVITCGGIQSNHARATALAARQLGLRPHILLRGTKPIAPQGNLLLDAWAGATIRWTDSEGYRQRDRLMQDWQWELASNGVSAKVIPEGGSNATGSFGYLHAGLEIAEQAEAAGVSLDSVVFACGSGGTAAGLLTAHLLQPHRVPAPVAVPVCDDSFYFTPRVRAIAAELLARVAPQTPVTTAPLRWLDGYVGAGYAQSRPSELDALAHLARNHGLILDPTYTGKAWLGMMDTLRKRPLGLGRNVVFVHTGGLPSLFGLPQVQDWLAQGGANERK